MLEEELSRFEDKKALNEVINHQKQIEEQKKKDDEELQRLESIKQ